MSEIDNSNKNKATLVFVLILICILYLPLMNLIKMSTYHIMPNWMIIVGIVLTALILIMMLIHSSRIIIMISFMSLFSNNEEQFIKSKSKPKVKRN